MTVVLTGEILGCVSDHGSEFADGPEPAALSVCGSEYNTALALDALGTPTRLLTRIGDDPFGRLARRLLDATTIEVPDDLVDSSRPTGLMVKHVQAPDDANVVYYRRGSVFSRLTAGDMPRVAFDGARRAHVTGITFALGTSAWAWGSRFIDVCAELDVPVSFDLNFRPQLLSASDARELGWSVAGRISDLLINEREARLLTGSSSVDAALVRLAGIGAERIVVTLGEGGALGLDAATGDVVHVSSETVNVVDTMGAGDAFNAGYIHALLGASPFIDALRSGSLQAAQVVQRREDNIVPAGFVRSQVHQAGTTTR
jgi:2-dehydro-3-deoxygluconokinase